MTFRDQQLQNRYERTVLLIKGPPPDEVPICALLDAWHWFYLIEGEESPRTRGAAEQLLSSELRPALRGWYRRCGENMNPAAYAESRDFKLAVDAQQRALELSKVWKTVTPGIYDLMNLKPGEMYVVEEISRDLPYSYPPELMRKTLQAYEKGLTYAELAAGENSKSDSEDSNP